MNRHFNNESVSRLLKLPVSIQVDLDFYSEEEQSKFSRYPNHSRISEIAGTTVAIPIAEFASNFLFHEKQPGMPDFGSIQSVEESMRRLLGMVGNFLEFGDSTISSRVCAELLPSYLSEYLGEAIGLSVINRIHGTTLADWTRISQNKGKHRVKIFDYSTKIASDGELFVELEAKGTCIGQTEFRHQNIKNQKLRIIEKKREVKKTEYSKPTADYSVLRYGIITAIEHHQNGVLRALLVDPPENSAEIEPKIVRLLNRMRFFRFWTSFILPRSRFATALSGRVADLEMLANPFELNRTPLRNADAEAFIEEMISQEFGQQSPESSGLLINRSRVSDSSAGGVLLKISDELVMFVGVSEEFLIEAAAQDFDSSLNFQASPITVEKSISCIVTLRRAVELGVDLSKADLKKTGYAKFRLSGQIHYSAEGLVFSILSLKENKLNSINLD